MQQRDIKRREELSALVGRFYLAFDARQKRPDLSLIADLVLPDATIIKHSAIGTDRTDLASFIARRQAWFNAGTLDGFWEEETDHQTLICETLACRLSWYRKFVPVVTAPKKGCKSFQFVRTHGRWWISGLAWADQPSAALI